MAAASTMKSVSSLAFVSAIALVAIAAQLASAADSCPSFNSANDVYNPSNLPYQCSDALAVCSDGLCSCLGGDSWDQNAGMCSNVTGMQGQICDDVNYCARLYQLCVGLAQNETNSTCGGDWWAFINEQVTAIVLEPERANESDLYDSCAGRMCLWVNQTYPSCELDTSYVCMAQFLANTSNLPPAPTFTPVDPAADVPIPTTVNGAPTVPVVRISALVVFTGDFSAVFNAGPAAIEKLKTSVANSFTTRFKRRFLCLAVALGSLQATVATDVPQGQTSSVTTITNNIKALNNDQSTSWVDSIRQACADSGGCATGIGAPNVKISSITSSPLSASSNPPVQQKCGSGCVAGIIIACVVVAAVITVIVVVIVKKSAASAGTGVVAHEPTEMKAAENNANAV